MQQNPDMVRLLRMAQSPAGQQFLALLQRSGGQQLQEAMEKAAAGADTDVKTVLASLLEDPQLQQLLRQMGGTP